MINLQNPIFADLNNYSTVIIRGVIPSYTALETQEKQTKLLKTAIRIIVISVGLFGFLLYHMFTFIRYIEV